MIYTVTLNPSIDYFVTVDQLHIGETNRALTEEMRLGGKGINVSLVLKNLGMDSCVLGYAAGFTGREIKQQLATNGLQEKLIFLSEGQSRINIKIPNMDGTEVNGIGPSIQENNRKELLTQLEKLVDGDVLILSGSLPKKVPSSFYKEMMKKTSGKAVRVILDTNKNALLEGLSEKPFLIKPNLQEMGEVFQASITNLEEAVSYAEKLQHMGARNVLVSAGAQGAFLLTESGQLYTQKAPEGKVVNSVGAGDSMIAGFAAILEQKNTAISDCILKEAFLYSVCCGSASAFSPGFATKEEINRLRDAIQSV